MAGEIDGAIMNVGSEGSEEGSCSEEDSDEEMVADVQEGEHIEPTAVAGEEADRDHEDLHDDEEAPARNVRHYKRRHSPHRACCPVFVKARGREDQRKAKESDEQEVVKVSMDYCSVRGMKLLVGREEKCKHVFCHLFTYKGLGDDRIVTRRRMNTMCKHSHTQNKIIQNKAEENKKNNNIKQKSEKRTKQDKKQFKNKTENKNDQNFEKTQKHIHTKQETKHTKNENKHFSNTA